ncbi:nicotinate-nucleotide pyrophosphorylase [carboxylating]-like [Clytia hemisphaerica]|uniref:nicotinate-nucleotide pyrophosphorylase [carboxylating]-like n=1 Tax=Clytia hemisphaerica TaxID=252671 RepID=UPI0034D3E4C9
MSLSSLLPLNHVEDLVEGWLSEDIPHFDYGGFVVGEKQSSAVILCKSKGVLCGQPFVNTIFEKLGCKVQWHHSDGTLLEPICRVAEVSGPVNKLLQGERLALNVLTRASGIATIGHQYQEIRTKNGWKGEIAATRKTTPGFRLVEKYAVLVGGCSTHRHDLSSMVMLKDNHIWSVGDIKKSVQKARSVCGFSTKIEVECRSVKEALEACSAGADVIMLDNFDAAITEKSAQEIKGHYPHVILEVSGGVTLQNASDYMTPTIDVLSSSSLTQGYSTLDFSMKIMKDGKDPTNPLVTA